MNAKNVKKLRYASYFLILVFVATALGYNLTPRKEILPTMFTSIATSTDNKINTTTSTLLNNVTITILPSEIIKQSIKKVTTSTKVITTQINNNSIKFPPWMKWGVYVGWQDNKMSDFEKLVGKSPQIESIFVDWGSNRFPSEYTSRIKGKGRIMLLFWESCDYIEDCKSNPKYSYDAVLNGSLDDYFKKFAKEAKNYGGEIILVPYSEFNGDWYQWGVTQPGNGSQKFIQAWIHIHNIFADVPNVKFAWTPNNDSVPDTPENNFDLSYPGYQYVDIVGIDGFNRSPWETFDQMMSNEIIRLKKYNRPIYILSMATKEDSRKAEWITDALTVQLYKYPEVKGWVWFNEDKEEDWRVNSDQKSLEAFQNALR